ncbi:hypothetical protein SynBIOSE41_03003 [Synechococcus sp. BIOS-E4-1]|nr:hypothetical protein SynBIOSE41_03003 [Synechococcus sp. BIOS-E4-1]
MICTQIITIYVFAIFFIPLNSLVKLFLRETDNSGISFASIKNILKYLNYVKGIIAFVHVP